mmetsp:Transcript_29761/g.81744  ORF Transcript_29761/g.81744 Transcript_29761/m.81744 type:complete len:210 (+) Transcript_29761:138-767(+)
MMRHTSVLHVRNHMNARKLAPDPLSPSMLCLRSFLLLGFGFFIVRIQVTVAKRLNISTMILIFVVLGPLCGIYIIIIIIVVVILFCRIPLIVVALLLLIFHFFVLCLVFLLLLFLCILKFFTFGIITMTRTWKTTVRISLLRRRRRCYFLLHGFGRCLTVLRQLSLRFFGRSNRIARLFSPPTFLHRFRIVVKPIPSAHVQNVKQTFVG